MSHSLSPNRWHYAVAAAAYFFVAVIAAPVFAASPSVFMEQGTNRPGADYKVLSAGSEGPQYCASACFADTQCRAWTYVRAGNEGPEAQCHLKLDVPHAQATPCCISGVTVGSSMPGRTRGY